jgi:hypothetical protein
MESIMAEITGDSPHAVAYALLERIADAEQWETSSSSTLQKSRTEILGAYKECLQVVLGTYQRFGPYGT